jgi:hypothetical protein
MVLQGGTEWSVHQENNTNIQECLTHYTGVAETKTRFREELRAAFGRCSQCSGNISELCLADLFV